MAEVEIKSIYSPERVKASHFYNIFCIVHSCTGDVQYIHNPHNERYIMNILRYLPRRTAKAETI